MRKRTVTLAVWTAACVWAIAATGDVTRAQRGEDFSVYLPAAPGPARAVVARECSACHDLGGIVKLRKPAKDWEAIVLDMGARGAAITIDDVDPVVAYLAAVFGPMAPPFTDISTATRNDLVKLPGVTPAAADALIAQRTAKGRLSTHDEVRAALALDAEKFERIKPYIYVKPETR
jgi:hypothetical protein